MIKVNVLSEENSWSKKIKKKESFFNKICKHFPKKYSGYFLHHTAKSLKKESISKIGLEIENSEDFHLSVEVFSHQ